MRPCNASTTYFVMQWNFTNQDLEGIRIFCRHLQKAHFVVVTHTLNGYENKPPFLFIMFEIKSETLSKNHSKQEKLLEIEILTQEQNENIDFCLQIDCYFFLLLPVYYYLVYLYLN